MTSHCTIGRRDMLRASLLGSAAALPSRLARSISRRPMVNWLVMSPPSPVLQPDDREIA